MEVQSMMLHQRTKIDVNRASETVPARKTLFLLTLDVPERIADVMQVELDTAFQQP
jgi:hypothetical protein